MPELTLAPLAVWGTNYPCFVSDNRAAIVAVTRVRATLIVGFAENDGEAKPEWKKRGRKDNNNQERHPMTVTQWRYLKPNERIIDIELPANDQIQETQDNTEWQSADPVSEEPSEDVDWNTRYEEAKNMNWWTYHEQNVTQKGNKSVVLPYHTKLSSMRAASWSRWFFRYIISCNS